MIAASRRSGAAAGIALFLSASAVLLTGASSPSPERPDTTATTVASSSALLSCPESTTGRGVSTSVLAVAPSAESTGRSGGELTVRALSTQDSGDVGRTDQSGVPVSADLGASAQPSVTVSADGGLAPGATAAQQTVFDTSRSVGLAVAACPTTADGWWYTGVDTSVGSTSRLVLSNPSPAVANVDLTFYGPKGAVSAVGAKGIAVAPESRQSLDLARFAPGQDAVTLHVRATRGRVAAAVGVSRLTGVTPAGNEWLAPSQPPSGDVLVDAGDSGDGAQRLVLTNTTAREALVQVDVLDANGPFTPKGLTDLRIRPGRTVVKDISTITDTSAAALHVTSDGGVTAALVSESGKSPVEFSTSSSSSALGEPAVVPAFPGSRVSLAFATTEDGGGAVRLQPYDGQGSPLGGETRLPIKADTTQTWDAPAKGVAYVVITVADGETVQGVATYHSAKGQSAIPINSGTWTITRPAVRPAG